MEGFQKVGCDAINVGHYEVLNGLSFLQGMVKKTDIPFISSNLKDSKSGQLLFDPYIIFERGELKIGVIGATDLIPDTMKFIQSDDFIESCNRYAKELENKVDIIVALVNASRSSQNGLPEKMPDIDFIVTSGNTSMSRTNSPQKKMDHLCIPAASKENTFDLNLGYQRKRCAIC